MAASLALLKKVDNKNTNAISVMKKRKRYRKSSDGAVRDTKVRAMSQPQLIAMIKKLPVAVVNHDR
jgi:hypothetical protein